MNSSVEEKIVGEVGGECNEASNPEESREFVSEAQTRDMLLETKMTENDEDGKDVVPVGDGNIEEFSLVETTRNEHLVEETHIIENEKNEYLKTEIPQDVWESKVCTRPENSDTSESSEKQIQGEEGFVEEPCLISVGKDTVTDRHQEADAGDPFTETHMKLEPVESGNDPIADQIAKTNEATKIIKNGTLIEEIQIKLEEMNKETTVSTKTREIISAKNEEGPYMNIHEKPTKSTPCEAKPTERMYDMVVKPSSLELEEDTSTNSETMISVTEDARNLDNLSEVVVEALASDIPDKEEKAREHEGEHIETQAINAVEEVEHEKNDVPEVNILKEGVKKLDEFNIQERPCESKDTQVQIPQHEETQVVLAVEQEITEESVMARIGNNNTSESFVEDQSQMKTDLKQEAKFAKPGPEGLSADQPSATETIVIETTVNLEERNRIPQNFERIPEASDTKNEEEGSREVDLWKATEANTATFLEDQSGSTEEKNNTEEQKPRDISEINGKPKEAECGQYKESINKTEPSMSDLILDFEREYFVEKKEPLESKVPLTVQVEKDAKEEEKYSADAEDEQVKEDSGSDAPVMVEASADVDVNQLTRNHTTYYQE
ncbi:eukaryotic translation initiation factor 5B-like [Papaver somniferum]|uniref:eukaryotic translation initiation factor 5B-like n=1 Tax=Papaver somniferum TaxID=3469 RepID=UPI000E7056BF|nr:eukaryotic translation initiation factor 5B-like [Papaver somniferum]